MFNRRAAALMLRWRSMPSSNSSRPGPRTARPARSTQTRSPMHQPGCSPVVSDGEVAIASSPDKQFWWLPVGFQPSFYTTHRGVQVMLSARNQFKGVVKSVKLGGVMAEVVVAIDNLEVVSAITRASAEALDLKAGDEVKAVIKSTDVLIDKP